MCGFFLGGVHLVFVVVVVLLLFFWREVVVNGCHLILSVEWTSSGSVQSFRPECFARKSLSLESPFSRP